MFAVSRFAPISKLVFYSAVVKGIKLADLTVSERGYRVRHHVSDLGWVDFDLELDVPLLLPNGLASSGVFSYSKADL